MKIQTITLREKEVVEIEGEFQERVINEKRYPASLTNKSLQIGKDLGILKSSKLVDILGFDEINVNGNKQEMAQEVASDFDPLKFIQVIYLAVIGFNKNLVDLTFEDFLEQYDEPTQKMMETFSKLIEGLLSDGSNNNFAKGLKSSTKKK